MSYGTQITLDLPYAEAVTRVRAALQEQGGFGVFGRLLTWRIDCPGITLGTAAASAPPPGTDPAGAAAPGSYGTVSTILPLTPPAASWA